MKNLVVLILSVFSIQAFATSIVPLECSKGTPGYDDYVLVGLVNKTASIQLHETHIQANRKQTRTSGNVLVILNKVLKTQAEGTKFSTKTTAVFVYDAPKNVLYLTLSLDGNQLYSAEPLTCTK